MKLPLYLLREFDFGQLLHFLLKDFYYDCQDAIKLSDKAVAATVIKSVTFNGKVVCRIDIIYWCQKHRKVTVVMDRMPALLFLKKVPTS